MPQTKTAYVYNKGSSRYISAGGQRVKKGEEIELTESELIDLTHRGFVFSPADKRRKMPEIVETINAEEGAATE